MKTIIKSKSIITALLLVASLLCTVMFQPMTAYADGETHTHAIAIINENSIISEETITFVPWDGGENHDTMPSESGSYYLTDNITLTGSWTIGENVTINLCLNGHSVGGSSYVSMYISSGAILNLYDCQSSGCVNRVQVMRGENGKNDGIFYMSGGTIKPIVNYDRSCVENHGVFYMSGGTICENHNDSPIVIGGGGVFNTGTFNMSGGTICENSARNSGGGVYNIGTFNMVGGTICENSAGDSGGGVYNIGTFNMIGGEISGNTASSRGGGVYCSDDSVTLGGSAKIIGNVKGGTISGGVLSGGTANNLHLGSDKTVTFNNPSSDMQIGVTTQTEPTEGTPVQITTNGASTNTSFFTPDNDAYEVKFNTNHLELAVKATSHNHNLVKVDGQAATETASGWQDYYECKDSTDACHAYFEDASGNTPITNLDEWKAEGGNGYIAKLDAPKYGITVSSDGTGTASASVSEAASGTTVTLTATPSSGYTFDSWEAISGGITISGNAFTMPTNAVEVKAKFKLATPEPGPTPDPAPDPEPQGNYLDSLDDMFEAAIATGSTDTIYWDEGDALPNYIMKLLFANPYLSLDFKYTYEGVEHEIYIGPGQATNDDIEWYGALWLLGKYGEKKDLPQIHGVYIVADGDTLNKLAKKFNTTVDELLRLNPAIKDKNRIYIGYSLKY